MTFRITGREVGKVQLVAVGGEFDLQAAPEVGRHLTALIRTGKCHLVLDLADATFIDSTALGVLVSAARRAREAGGSFEVTCDNRHILRVFDFMGIEEFFSVYRSREEAALTRAEATPKR